MKFAAAMSAGLNQAAAAARKLYAAPERRARAVRSATRKSLQHTNSATGRIWTLSRSTPLQCRTCAAAHRNGVTGERNDAANCLA